MRRLLIVKGLALWRAKHLAFVLAGLLLVVTAVPALAHGDHPDPLAVTFDQRLDQPLPLELRFRDESGEGVRLGDYFGEKPAVVVMGYFECPTLCVNVVFPELVKAVDALPELAAGADFSVIAVSIDAAETPAEAASLKSRLLPGERGAGWHFLTGPEDSIAGVADTIGFHYSYDETQDQYAHPTGVVTATPDGRVSGYLLGLDFPVRDLRLALLDAGEGTIGTAVDQLLLICYRYDPDTGRYTNMVWAAARLLGVGSVLGLAAVIWRASRRVDHD